MPTPVAPAGVVIVSHVAFDCTVHAHVAPVVTVTLPLPAPLPKFALGALNPNVHVGGAPACVTLNVCPAIVSVPLRSDVPVFAATE